MRVSLFFYICEIFNKLVFLFMFLVAHSFKIGLLRVSIYFVSEMSVGFCVCFYCIGIFYAIYSITRKTLPIAIVLSENEMKTRVNIFFFF